MNVVKPLHKLLEQVLSIGFLKPSSLSYIGQKISALAKLHHEAHVLRRFKRVVELHDAGMARLLEYGHLLHHPLFLFLFGSKYLLLD